MPVSSLKWSARVRKRHDDFFERGVAGALADAVDGAFDLARAGGERGDGIGDAEAEIVVAVRAQTMHVVDAAHFALQAREQRVDFVGRRVADGIGHVHRRGAGLDHRRQHLDQEFGLGADRIFGAKTRRRRKAYGARRTALMPVSSTCSRLMLSLWRRWSGLVARKMWMRACSAVFGARAHGFDVADLRAGEAADDRPANFAWRSRAPNRNRRRRPAGSRPRCTSTPSSASACAMRSFCAPAHRESGRLFAVAQGGVENADAFALRRELREDRWFVSCRCRGHRSSRTCDRILAKKNPASVSRCGVLGFSSGFARRVLSRTSVDNKKYEDEKGEGILRNELRDDALREQVHALRCDGIGAVAVRHGTDLKRRPNVMSTLICKWHISCAFGRLDG